jgi:LacI family transcriptional regulator
MRDVAALAGVSLKTVSRVVNGESVSAALVTRVDAAVARLGYRPNLTASSLRRRDGRTATVGLLLEDVGNPFSSAVHRAVEDAARARGVVVFAASSDEDAAREHDAVAVFASRRVDGLIMVPASHDQSYLLAERRAGTAIVMIDRPPAFLDVDSVTTDNRVGAAAGTGHLLRAGHRRIGYLGDLATIDTAAARLAGYRDALAAAVVPVETSLVHMDVRSAGEAERLVARIMTGAQAPTAIFCARNALTIGAVRALRRLDRHHRTALVGFDDFPLADMLEPPVTVVSQDPYTVGSTAAEQLFRRIDGDASPTVRLVIPTRLVPRGSGEIPPA